MPRSTHIFAMATLRVCMPGTTPCALHFSITFRGLEKQRIIELAGNSQGDGKVGRSDHDYVQAWREQFVGALHGAHGLELDDGEGIAILMLDDFRHAARFVTHHGGVDAETADAQRRKTQPAKRLFESALGHSTRGRMIPCAPGSSSRAHSEYCSSPTRTMGVMPASARFDHVLDGFQVE